MSQNRGCSALNCDETAGASTTRKGRLHGVKGASGRNIGAASGLLTALRLCQRSRLCNVLTEELVRAAEEADLITVPDFEL